MEGRKKEKLLMHIIQKYIDESIKKNIV